VLIEKALSKDAENAENMPRRGMYQPLAANKGYRMLYFSNSILSISEYLKTRIFLFNN
jgi:hypothetical protein